MENGDGQHAPAVVRETEADLPRKTSNGHAVRQWRTNVKSWDSNFLLIQFAVVAECKDAPWNSVYDASSGDRKRDGIRIKLAIYPK